MNSKILTFRFSVFHVFCLSRGMKGGDGEADCGAGSACLHYSEQRHFDVCQGLWYLPLSSSHLLHTSLGSADWIQHVLGRQLG